MPFIYYANIRLKEEGSKWRKKEERGTLRQKLSSLAVFTFWFGNLTGKSARAHDKYEVLAQNKANILYPGNCC